MNNNDFGNANLSGMTAVRREVDNQGRVKGFVATPKAEFKLCCRCHGTEKPGILVSALDPDPSLNSSRASVVNDAASSLLTFDGVTQQEDHDGAKSETHLKREP